MHTDLFLQDFVQSNVYNHCKPKPCISAQRTTFESIPTGKNLFLLQGTTVLITGSLFLLQGFPCKPLYFSVSDCSVGCSPRWYEIGSFSGPPWLTRPPGLDFGFQYALIRNNWSKRFGIEYRALLGPGFSGTGK